MNHKLASVLLAATLSVLPLISCSKPEGKPLYFAFQLNSKEQVKLAQDVLHQTRKRIGSESEIVVDAMKSGDVINLYSDRAKSSSIRELMDSLVENQSNSSAIVQAVNRATLFGRQQVGAITIIVSPGTCDESSLRAISSITKNVSNTTHLFMVGVAPENRLCMSQAFTAIRDRVKFASSDEEWLSVINKL